MRPPVPAVPRPLRLSIELTRRCGKGCAFCYNASSPAGETWWTREALAALLDDCVAHGLEAVSFGGGEPLESPLLVPLLTRYRGALGRAVTTNGLPLDAAWIARLAELAVERVHVSIHFPGSAREVDRVRRQVDALRDAGVPAGVNLLIRRETLDAARRAARRFRDVDVVALPMRGPGAPTPREVADVMGRPFQSAACLTGCGASAPFASLGWDGRVGWCSYTVARQPLSSLTYAGLTRALGAAGLASCGPPPGALTMPRNAVPAAHSMDTEWFAVDGDGCVALFDSLEQGPVPLRHQERVEASYWEDVHQQLAEAGVTFDAGEPLGPVELEVAGEPRRAVTAPADVGTHVVSALLWIPPGPAVAEIDEALRALLGEWGTPWSTGADGQRLLDVQMPFMQFLDPQRVFDWVERGLVARAILRTVYGNDPQAHFFGLFDYLPLTYTDDGPYTQLGRPARPLRLTELPAAVQSLAVAVPWPHLRFADHPRLDPPAHAPCTIYGPDSPSPPRPLPVDAPLPPPVTDRTGHRLIADALDGDPDRVAVLADWLLEHGVADGAALRAGAPVFPAALRLLPAALQHPLACAAYEHHAPDALPLLDDGRPLQALQAKRDWLRDRDDARLAEVHLQARELGVGAVISTPEPRIADVLREASWLAAATSAEPWDVARAAAEARQIALIREALA